MVPVHSDLSSSMQLGGTWVPADWWLQPFKIFEEFAVLRLKHPTADLSTQIMPLLPAGISPMPSLKCFNDRPSDTDASPANRAFTTDPQRIATANPQRSAWQQQVYGESAAR